MGNRLPIALVVGLAAAIALFGASATAVAAQFDPKGGMMERVGGANTAAVSYTDGVAYVRRAYINGPGRVQYGDALCPRNWEVLGGGASTQSPNQFVNATHPLDTRDRGRITEDGWRAWVGNGGSSGARVTIYATCLR